MTTRRTATVFALMTLAAGAGRPAAAAEKEWVSVGLGGGGGIFVPASSPHDPKLMFCASDMSGVYRSTDGGRSWRMLHWRQLSGAIASPILFHPKDPNVLYCIPGTWATPVLKVSRDRGLTWRPLTEQTPWQHATPQSTLPAIGPGGEVLLVSSAKGTFRSDDEGETWTQAGGLKEQVVSFFLPPAGGKHAFWYAAAGGRLLRSADRGASWQLCGGKGLPGPIQALCGGADPATGEVVLYCSVPSKAVDGKFSGGIFRSEDGGASWGSAMGKGINVSVGRRDRSGREVAEYAWLAMGTNQTRTVWAYCYGNGTEPPYHDTAYRSDDGGRSWRATFFRGPDVKGQNVSLPWIRLDRGHGGRVLGFSVNARDSRVVAFTDAMELYLTTDGGRTWRQAYTECAEPPPGPGKPWRSIGLEMTTTWHFHFDPRDHRRCYICYTDIGFARSTDRGGTWYYSAKGSPWTNTFYDVAFDPARAEVIYAACAYEHDIPSWKMAGRLYGGGGVCISTDYGKTWRPISKGLPAVGACTGVELDPKSPPDRRTLYCSFYGGGVYKSSDGGGSWQPRNKGLNTDANDHFTDIKLHRDGTLYALCGGKADAQDRRKPAAVGGLFRSSDGGESWAELTRGMSLWLPYGFDVHPTDSKVLYLCVSAVPRRHDEAGVYKSTDGGQSWKKFKIDWPADGPGYVHASYPSIDPYQPERVWVSTGTHGLFVTTDGGKTWKRMNGPPFRGVSRVTVDPDHHETIWATTFGGGIWRGPAADTE